MGVSWAELYLHTYERRIAGTKKQAAQVEEGERDRKSTEGKRRETHMLIKDTGFR